MRIQLSPGLRIEELDNQTIVLDRTGAAVHHLHGDAVEALRLVQVGLDESDVPAHLSDAITSLQSAGVLVATTRWSRRKLLVTGGVGVATVTTFALSSPAAAASVCGPTPPGQTLIESGMTYTFLASTTVFTGPMVTAVTVHAQGGGGGGGGASDMGGGGGGGGGAYSSGSVTGLIDCMSYSVVVGAGGTSGAGAMSNSTTAGGTGMASSFEGVSASGGVGGSGGAGGGGAGGLGGSGTLAGGTGGAGAMDGGGGGGGGGAGSATAGMDGASASMSTNGGGGAGGTGTPSGGTGGTGAGTPAPIVPGGGGGGGAVSAGNGTAGAAGQVILVV